MIIGGFADLSDADTIVHWQRTLDLGTYDDKYQPLTESHGSSSKQDVDYINTWTADAVKWAGYYEYYLTTLPAE